MKKIVAAIALVAAMALPAVAQVKIGVTAGLNMTKLSVPTSFKNVQLQAKSAEGWFVGPKVYVGIPLAGLGVDAALLYNQRKVVIGTPVADLSTNKTLRSFAVPINLRYNIGLSRFASLYVATGPQFDFNIGDKDWDIALFRQAGSVFQTKKSEVSWNVGAGARVLSHLELGVGYNFGVGKTAGFVKELTGIFGGKPSTRSNTFTVQATYIF